MAAYFGGNPVSVWAASSEIVIQQPAGPIADKQLIFDVPFALKQYSSLGSQAPDQMDRKYFQPPLSLSYSSHFLAQDVPEHAIKPWIEANLSFMSFTGVPIVGVTPGLELHTEGFNLEVGLELEDQDLIKSEPFRDSQFSTFLFDPLGRVRYQWQGLTLGLQSKLIETIGKARLSNYEGIETLIDHNQSSVWTLSASYLVPQTLRAGVSVDLYELGATAISSKEFSFGIDSRSLVRLGARLSYIYYQYEFYAQVYDVQYGGDQTELYYQAPFLSRDYLLAPVTLSLGVIWTL